MTRRNALFALQAAMTVGLLVLLFRRFDWQALQHLLAGLPWWFYAGAFVTVLAGQVIYALRWYVVLSALRVPVSAAATMNMFFVGVFFNNFLPSTMGGDSVKVYYLGRAEGYARIGASVLIDRVLSLFFVATVALALTREVWAGSGALSGALGAIVAIWGGLVAALIAIAIAPPDFWLGRLRQRWPRLGAMIDGGNRVLADMQAVLRRPQTLALSGGLAMAYFGLLGFVYQYFIQAATGTRPALIPVIGVVAAIATLSNLPVAINGLGLREQLHLALLGTFGLSAEAAAGISLLLFANLLAVSTIGAICWLSTPGGRAANRAVNPAPAAGADV